MTYFFIYLYYSLNGMRFKSSNGWNGNFYVWERFIFPAYFIQLHYILQRFPSYSQDFKDLHCITQSFGILRIHQFPLKKKYLTRISVFGRAYNVNWLPFNEAFISKKFTYTFRDNKVNYKATIRLTRLVKEVLQQ